MLMPGRGRRTCVGASGARPHSDYHGGVSLHGHRWTIVPRLGAERRLGPERGTPWSTTLQDPRVGEVKLTGFMEAPRGFGTLVVLVHGLGGSPDSIYLRQAARAFGTRGFDTLRPALRGGRKAIVEALGQAI